jgi:hypothetical protein
MRSTRSAIPSVFCAVHDRKPLMTKPSHVRCNAPYWGYPESSRLGGAFIVPSAMRFRAGHEGRVVKAQDSLVRGTGPPSSTLFIFHGLSPIGSQRHNGPCLASFMGKGIASLQQTNSKGAHP